MNVDRTLVILIEMITRTTFNIPTTTEFEIIIDILQINIIITTTIIIITIVILVDIVIVKRNQNGLAEVQRHNMTQSNYVDSMIQLKTNR
jgi:hypothetical protein